MNNDLQVYTWGMPLYVSYIDILGFKSAHDYESRDIPNFSAQIYCKKLKLITTKIYYDF